MARMRLVLVDDDGSTLTAAAPVPPETAAPPATEEAVTVEDWHVILVVEDTWTGDNRFFESGSITWAPLPLPFMADDENNEAHLNSKLVGTINRIERIGNEVHGWVGRVEAGDGADADRVRHLQALMDTGSLKGVSFDGDSPDLTVEFPPLSEDPMFAAMMAGEEMDPDEPTTIEVNADTMPKEIYHGIRLIGATALPFPAFQEAQILTAAGTLDTPNPATFPAGITGWVDCDCSDTAALIASITPPMHPPAAWFPTGPFLTEWTPPTVTDEGRTFGHLAYEGSCHVGISGYCQTPPHSLTDYAYFHTKQVLTAEGGRVNVGNITMSRDPLDDGHASQAPGTNRVTAVRHYDNVCTVVADVVVGEDDYGIWYSGALRPNVTALQVRQLMGADLSGDWREVDGNLEMIACLAVNVGGFQKRRQHISVQEDHGLVASLIATYPAPDRPPRRTPPPVMKAGTRKVLADLLATSIGRDKASRVAQLRQVVHGAS